MQWEQIKITNMILHNMISQRHQALRRFKRNYNFIPGPFWCKHIGRTGMWKRWEWPKLQKSRLKYNFHNRKYPRHPCQLPQHRLLHPFVHFLHLLLLYSWLILFCFLQFQDHSYNPIGIKSLFKWFTILFFWVSHWLCDYFFLKWRVSQFEEIFWVQASWKLSVRGREFWMRVRRCGSLQGVRSAASIFLCTAGGQRNKCTKVMRRSRHNESDPIINNRKSN